MKLIDDLQLCSKSGPSSSQWVAEAAELDARGANRIELPLMGLGRSRDHLLADYYLKAAGIALVWIGAADGHIGAQDVARVGLDPDCIGYCCPRGAHFVLAYRLQLWKQDQPGVAPSAIAERLEQLAFEGGVGLTEHQVAAERALAAVARVEQKLDAMKEAGELRDMHAAFKAARAADPSLRYGEFMNAKKAALLESIARSAS